MNKQEIERAIETLRDFNKCVVAKADGAYETIDFVNAKETAISALTQQLNNGWIPVSSGKMPKFDMNCLVTADNGEVWTSKFYGYGEQCQGFREYPDGVWEINQCELDVVAWQPLPEPYKEVSE